MKKLLALVSVPNESARTDRIIGEDHTTRNSWTSNFLEGFISIAEVAILGLVRLGHSAVAGDLERLVWNLAPGGFSS